LSDVYIGKIAGDYIITERRDKDFLIYKCTKCGAIKVMNKTCSYRKPKCKNCSHRSNAVLIPYKGKKYTVKEMSKLTGYSEGYFYTRRDLREVL
jgi:DNA-directed RNA polymerase subunit RPC12/RpoP